MKHNAGFYEKYVKRGLDIILSLMAMVLLSPVIAATALGVFVTMGRPLVYKQKRPGKDEKIIYLCKFRSMTNEKDAEGNLLPDDRRLTKFGQLIRSFSLDELPSLWNILKGDISIVGPRPLLVKYLPLYSERQHHRHDVRPGLTGYAQANGRNALTWEEKFEHDLYYVDNIGFALDVKIVFKTAIATLKREGISEDGNATMSEFTGSAKETVLHGITEERQ